VTVNTINTLLSFRTFFNNIVKGIFVLFCAVQIFGCTYYNETIEDSVGDNYFPDYHTSKIVAQVQDAINVVNGRLTISNGGVITSDTTSAVKTLTINYGPDFVEKYDGVRRKGRITVTWDSTVYLQGSTVNVTIEEGCGFNQYTCKGSIEINFWGLNRWDQPEYEIRSDIELIEDNERKDILDWTNEYVRTLIVGGKTVSSMDDVWAVMGTSYARNRKGRYYDAVIKDSIYFFNNCAWGIVDGRVDIKPVDASQRMFVDYGTSGVCNQYYTFRRGERFVTITKNP